MTETQVAVIPAYDYNQLAAYVQQRLDENKTAGRDLFNGVVKGFTVNIPVCTNAFEAASLLSFLSAQAFYVRSEFVSPGTVRILVQPSFDSVQLKDAMRAQGIDFNFINEFYALNP